MESHIKNVETIRDPVSRSLIKTLFRLESKLGLETATLLNGCPLLPDDSAKMLSTNVVVVSPNHGILVFYSAELTDMCGTEIIEEVAHKSDEICGGVLARLAKNRETRLAQNNVTQLIYAPLLSKNVENQLGIPFIKTEPELIEFIRMCAGKKITEGQQLEVVAALELSRILKKPKTRSASKLKSKGRTAVLAELEITNFDRGQVEIFLNEIDRPQRIKGLAGSGKTVVLAVKAAILHAFYPEMKIAFTFYTKSLKQHIKSLIREFYVALAEKEPNWNQLVVMHAWGGRTIQGLYSTVCDHHGVQPITYGNAPGVGGERFDAVCTKFLRETKRIEPVFDCVFVDEGQDFPTSFLRLATLVAKGGKIIWAYDALQNIFDIKVPDFEEIFGNNLPDVDDETLKKCYRNPSEVLVTAHALGFGIYEHIIQMLENKEHWEDLGYLVKSGELVTGEKVVIERPPTNSLETISKNYRKNEIVQVVCFNSIEEEVQYVAKAIESDIRTEELRPDDIMVVCVDKAAAKNYLNGIETALSELRVLSNNRYTDDGPDFSKPGTVTLATVNRAKGNEAYMVYVVGTDALFQTKDDITSRNALFTAMTRAKGWVTLTGCSSEPSPSWKHEIELALHHAPSMEFIYPSEHELVVMKRRLREGKEFEERSDRLDKYLRDMSTEDIEKYLAQRKYARNKLEQFSKAKEDLLRESEYFSELDNENGD